MSINGIHLARDDSETWKTKVPGIGVATATTLLSALWPDHHVIIDRLAWQAAVALRISTGSSSLKRRPEDTKALPEITWDDYIGEYRPWVLATAEATNVKRRDVERTLYQPPRGIPAVKVRSWSDYGALLRDRYPVA